MAKISQERKDQREKNIASARKLFNQWGGENDAGFPAIHSKVFYTEKGVAYLKGPGVILIAKPRVNLNNLQRFLDGYPSELDFGKYLQDEELPDGSNLVMAAGQECYASYGSSRTKHADADGYVEQLKHDEHGSVLIHPQYSFLVYGVSRNVTHEWVRHGTGTGYSQRSQRYVGGPVLRFVERPEYQGDRRLHYLFESRINRAARDYQKITDILLKRQRSGKNQVLSAEAKTDRRKKVQQTSRSLLPNETETSLVFSANARALQHMITMRTSEHAEVEIRKPFIEILLCLMMVDPILFADFEIKEFSDGTFGAQSPYRKP